MDLHHAVLVHQQWKSRLNQILGGTSQEKLDPAIVSRDDQCELGRWIHGEGRRQFHDLPEFQELQRCHAHFHVKAGQVVRMALNGNVKAAQDIFDREFPEDSKEIAVAVQRLKRLVPAH
ncbi:hypothetical protein GETHLI_24470 [Geothrix limicola]|uniref:Chemoreceptor zinc-binding domain-containing protein n=1 Tax=Geothrix limicola TaxID=2927978 RepID=A0ABQ5QGG4_9BACT|nr:CZB domain-containing protein [Geothrix limicola]GLH73945.1 hypothetical protein GETHLI_24470 [Geothrix limicola]